MNKKHFYSHIITIEEIEIELQNLSLSDEERIELLDMAEETLHHSILDALLSELSEDDKRIFLLYLVEESHEKVWDHLARRIENLEKKILLIAKDMKKDFIKDIQATQEE